MTSAVTELVSDMVGRTHLIAGCAIAVSVASGPTRAAQVGGVDLGSLTDYLFVFTDGNKDANWQSSSKGYVGDVAVDGEQADERTSGTVPYSGTIFTNDATLGKWQDIVDDNPGQASASFGNDALIAGLESDLDSAFAQVDALTPTLGFGSVSSVDLDGLNTQDGIAQTYVINVTRDLKVSQTIDITGDADDFFVLRWDDDLTTAGYQGETKFQSGGGINPLGGLMASNFLNVAGNINASGGGGNPSGLTDALSEIEEIDGGQAVDGGGFFTGYWLTTGDPDKNFETSSLSNAIFAGGWYSSTTKFSMTSGTSGVRVAPREVAPIPVPAAIWLLAAGAAGLLGLRRRAVRGRG